MSNIVNLDLHRRMRMLQKGVNDIAAGRVPLMIRGRTQGKTMTVDQVLQEMEEYFNHPGVPVGSGVRELQEESGLDLGSGAWYSLRGRGRDMLAQLPTAQVLEFKPQPAIP